MSMLIGTWRALLGARRSYRRKVLGYNPIAFWMQEEGVGLVSIDQINSPLQDGAYTGITWPDPIYPSPTGAPSPLFDAVNDYNDVLTATLQGAMNNDEITVIIWAHNDAAWNEGVTRFAFRFEEPGGDTLMIWKHVAANSIGWRRTDAAGNKDVVTAGHADTGWMNLAVTASVTDDEFIAYKDGLQEGAIQNGLGAFAAVPTILTIGARNIVPASVWDGHIALCAVFASALPPAAILDLATV